MYHAKKFSMTSLVPHKTQGVELAVVSPVKNPASSAAAPSGSASASAGAGKQRLRWTSDLHDRFVDAITQLGGPDSGYFLFYCIVFYFLFKKKRGKITLESPKFILFKFSFNFVHKFMKQFQLGVSVVLVNENKSSFTPNFTNKVV